MDTQGEPPFPSDLKARMEDHLSRRKAKQRICDNACLRCWKKHKTQFQLIRHLRSAHHCVDRAYWERAKRRAHELVEELDAGDLSPYDTDEKLDSLLRAYYVLANLVCFKTQ